MTPDYRARQKPEQFKPLIDAALARLASLSGAALTLAEVSEGTGPWGYLTEAIAQNRAALTGPKVRAALGEHTWYDQFLTGHLADNLNAGSVIDSEDDLDPEDDYDPDAAPVVLAYYPAAAHACLRQELFIGGADADLFALWPREDRTSVCHAHMEGFWILGEDPIDFIERIADRAEGKTRA